MGSPLDAGAYPSGPADAGLAVGFSAPSGRDLRIPQLARRARVGVTVLGVFDGRRDLEDVLLERLLRNP